MFSVSSYSRASCASALAANSGAATTASTAAGTRNVRFRSRLIVFLSVMAQGPPGRPAFSGDHVTGRIRKLLTRLGAGLAPARGISGTCKESGAYKQCRDRVSSDRLIPGRTGSEWRRETGWVPEFDA